MPGVAELLELFGTPPATFGTLPPPPPPGTLPFGAAVVLVIGLVTFGLPMLKKSSASSDEELFFGGT